MKKTKKPTSLHINKLKIGGFDVEIRYVKDLPDDGNLCGENAILINDELSPNERDLTLIHEIIHKINPAMGEKEVEYLSRAIHQIYKDNYKYPLYAQS